jgi:hypothetical protein
VKLDEKDWIVWGNLADGYQWAPGMQNQAASAYRKALSLGKQQLQVNARDATVLGYMAYYHTMLGERAEGQNCERMALLSVQI